MGLFDAYDSATYQGPQGGLLDRLLASVAAAPTDPVPGFPASPMDAQASAPAPQPQNAPMQIGNYMMPRIGSGFDLPTGQLDPNTGEHVAPAPVAAPMQQPAAPTPILSATQRPEPAPGSNPFSNFLNKAADGLESVAHGGTLLGAIRGQPTDARSIQQRQLKLQYDAFVGAGLTPQQATLAVLNPEAGKALVTQALGPPQAAPQYAWDPKTGKAVHLYEPEQKDNFQVVQTGENGIGGKTFQRMNKATGEMTPLPGASPGGDTGGGIGDMSLTGPAYLATVPKAQAGIMRGMVDGTIQPPSSFAASKPYWQSMIAGAKNLDPNFDENTWTARHKMSGDLASSGNSSMGGILSNGGSSFSHLAELSSSMADLGNTSHDFPMGGLVAYGQNAIGNTLGGSDTKAKIKAINDNLGHYGQESTKFYSGTGGGAEERMNALKEMNPTSTSSEEMAAYAEKEKGLMLDRLNNKFQQIRDTYGEEQGNRIIAKKLPEIQKNIATIDANIARMRGSAPGAANITPLDIGQSTQVGNVSIKRVN